MLRSVDLYSAGRILQPQAICNQEQEHPCAYQRSNWGRVRGVTNAHDSSNSGTSSCYIATTAPVDPIVALLKLKGLLEPGATTQVEFDAKIPMALTNRAQNLQKGLNIRFKKLYI